MRFVIGVFCVAFAFIAKTAELQSSVQHLTHLGPDIGFLIDNPTSEKVRFNLNVLPKGCPSLGLDSMKLRGSMSSIDSHGEIKPNDFMVAYYSLGAYNYKMPCLLNVYLETIAGDRIEESFFVLDASSQVDMQERSNEKIVENPLDIKHSFKRMNNTHYELTLLLQNKGVRAQVIELERLAIECQSGDVFLKQTDNFPDGIKNGRSEIKVGSWRAYKVIYKSSKEYFKCTSSATFSRISKSDVNYIFDIESVSSGKSLSQ